MGETSLRFGIVEKGRRAATWHLRSQISKTTGLPEVYLFCRELNNAIHSSMHPSGHWHTAYPREFFDRELKENSPAGTDRFIEKWERPQEIKPGVTLAFKILTPFSAIRRKPYAEEKKLIQIPNAPKGKATEILILFIAKNIQFEIKNAEKVGELTLSNGEKVFVAHHVIEMPTPTMPTNKANPRYFRDKSLADLFSRDLYMIAFGETNTGARVIWDCAVKIGWKILFKALWLKIKKAVGLSSLERAV